MASPTLEAAIGGDLEETTSTTPDMVHQLVRRARGAQAVFEQFPQERVDAIVRSGPGGAIAVAGIATAIVIGLWFAFYLLVFLPRSV